MTNVKKVGRRMLLFLFISNSSLTGILPLHFAGAPCTLYLTTVNPSGRDNHPNAFKNTHTAPASTATQPQFFTVTISDEGGITR